MAKRRKRQDELPELTRLELEVMDVVWTLGECSSAEVIERYTRERPLAPTTIRTVLANLRKKGYLEPVPTIERGFRLRAVAPREAVARRTLPALIRHLFAGSPTQAIAYLIRNERIGEAELAEIRRLIDAKHGGRRS